jgi:hypothetical protein
MMMKRIIEEVGLTLIAARLLLVYLCMRYFQFQTLGYGILEIVWLFEIKVSKNLTCTQEPELSKKWVNGGT